MAVLNERTVDGGDLGCGEMLLLLRRETRDAPPGTRVRVLTTDRGAPVEVPAWCRLAGHRYLGQGGPGEYVVELSTGGSPGPRPAPSTSPRAEPPAHEQAHQPPAADAGAPHPDPLTDPARPQEVHP